MLLVPGLDHVGVIAQWEHSLQQIASCLCKLKRSSEKSSLLNGTVIFVDHKLYSTLVESKHCHLFDQIITGGMFGEVPPLEVNVPDEIFELIKHKHVIMAAEAFEWHSERWRRFPYDYPTCIYQKLAKGAVLDARQVLQPQQLRRDLKTFLVNWWPSLCF